MKTRGLTEEESEIASAAGLKPEELQKQSNYRQRERSAYPICINVMITLNQKNLM